MPAPRATAVQIASELPNTATTGHSCRCDSTANSTASRVPEPSSRSSQRQARNSWLVKRKFVRQHPRLVRHLSQSELKDLIDGSLLRRGYDNFWRRDLESAQRIFRMSLVKGGWRAKDLVYLLPSLLPPGLYRRVVRSRDR